MASAQNVNELIQAVKEDILPENIFGQMRFARSNKEQPKQFHDELEAMHWILLVFNRRRA